MKHIKRFYSNLKRYFWTKYLMWEYRKDRSEYRKLDDIGSTWRKVHEYRDKVEVE